MIKIEINYWYVQPPAWIYREFHFTGEKEINSKKYILCDSTYIILFSWQNAWIENKLVVDNVKNV